MSLKRALLTVAIIGLPAWSGAALAEESCTKEPQAKWLSIDQMKAKIDAAGYTKYDKVLVSGSCYEIYGYNKDGKMVEVYFNPIDGAVHKEEVEDHGKDEDHK